MGFPEGGAALGGLVKGGARKGEGNQVGGPLSGAAKEAALDGLTLVRVGLLPPRSTRLGSAEQQWGRGEAGLFCSDLSAAACCGPNPLNPSRTEAWAAMRKG